LLVTLDGVPIVRLLADHHDLARLEPLRRGVEQALRELLAEGVAA
jgi:hypothetical protein